MCKFLKALEDVSPTEWLLLLAATLMSAQLSIFTRDDPENRHLHPVCVLQTIYYLIRSVIPVCGFLREKLQIEVTVEREEEDPVCAEAAS